LFYLFSVQELYSLLDLKLFFNLILFLIIYPGAHIYMYLSHGILFFHKTPSLVFHFFPFRLQPAVNDYFFSLENILSSIGGFIIFSLDVYRILFRNYPITTGAPIAMVYKRCCF
jgi:hypothetical protein